MGALPHRCPPSQKAGELAIPDLLQDPQHYQQESPGTMGRAGHLLPGYQGEQSHHTTQAGITGPGDRGDRQHPSPHLRCPGTAAEVAGLH